MTTRGRNRRGPAPSDVILIAKRIYQGEIIELLTSTMGHLAANLKLQEIARFPGQIPSDDPQRDAEGELWIEIERQNGDLVGDPICFSREAALDALIRTGVEPERAAHLLSDAYAESWLIDYYADAAGVSRDASPHALRIPMA